MSHLSTVPTFESQLSTLPKGRPLSTAIGFGFAMGDDRSDIAAAIKRTVRFAVPDEAADLLSILRGAARWSSRFGNPIWHVDEFTLEEGRRLAEVGELVCGLQDGRMTACMRLQGRDALFWPDDPPGEALYIHKVAVDRRDAGKGWTGLLINFAVSTATASRAPYLRLDTLPVQRMLRIYSKLGFVQVDEEARNYGGRTLVRMQRRL